MSNMPPTNPYGQPPGYEQFPPPEDNAPKLVRLAVIFNYISVGLDFVGFLGCLGLGVMILAMSDEMGRQQNPGDPPPQLIGGLYAGAGCMMAVLGVVKLIGARKISKGGPGAWGWGLTIGIIGAAQLVCGSCFCLQPAAGIYTIVIMCFQNVKTYLQQSDQMDAGLGGYGPGPFAS
jgi:hypothetical protein